jgi:hypothetical protein
MATPAQVAGTILVVTEIPNLYSGLLPSMFTISSPFFHDQDAKAGNVKRIRQGEVIATVGSLAIIFASAELFGSNLPVVWGLVMIAALLACYEYALRNPATDHDANASRVGEAWG